MPDMLNEQLNSLIADGIATRVFMVEIANRMALSSGNAEQWRKAFITRLHALLDAFEASMTQPDEFGWIEGARQRVDRMAEDIRIAAGPPNQSGSS